MRQFGEALRSLNGPVLITGHTGFKGTWLTLMLEQLGVPTAGFSLAPKDDSLFSRTNRLGRIPEFFGDITSRENVDRAFTRFKPSCVIHMAAEAIVLSAYKNPIETFSTNIMGTANILDAATTSSEVIISGCVTSDKVYQNNNTMKKFKEDDKLGGNDPYSASKVGAEQAILAWRNLAKSRNKSNILGLRAGNVIGGGDFAQHRIIPDIVRAMYFREDLIIRDKFATRPWQHVLDPLIGYVMALEYSLTSEAEVPLDYNFGPDNSSLSVESLINIALKTLPGKKIALSYENSTRYEASVLELSSEKAKTILGWKPNFSQEQAIATTFKWWKEHLELGVSAQSLCETEIKQILEKIDA